MLRNAGLGLAVLALTAVIASPAMADTLPVKRAEKNGDRARVAERLQQVGVPAAEAVEQVAKLPSKDVAFFAADGDRVQVVAGLWSEEWLVGGGFLALMGVITYIMLDDATHE